MKREYDVAFENLQSEWEDTRIEKELKRWKEKESELSKAAKRSRLNRQRLLQDRIKPATAEIIKLLEDTKPLFPLRKSFSTANQTKLYIVTTKDKWPVKIGVSYNPIAKVKSLQTANWETLELFKEFECPGNSAYYFETRLHKELNIYELNGEWFNLTAEEAELTVWKIFESKKELFGTDITSL